MPLVPALGILQYNGYLFSVYRTTRVSARPVSDRANRTTVGVEYTIDVLTQIVADTAAGDTSTDTKMLDIRRRLTTTGAVLSLSGMGFGDLVVNSPGSAVKDISYGPHPRIAECTPIGGKMAWSVHWVCTTMIPECSAAKYAGQPMAFNYTWSVSKDKHGFSTRTLTGYLEIPANRVPGTRQITDQADAYWENMMAGFPPLIGFTRTWSKQLSEDKRTLNFTITDEEQPPNALVENMTEWDADHEFVSGPQGVLSIGTSTLSATYKVARDKPKKVALEHFISLVQNLVKAGKPFNVSPFYPTSFRARDHITGRDVSFSVSWMTGAKSLANLVAAAGMWAPVPNTNYAAWLASVSASAMHVRGNAKLFYNKTSDSIVDLCATPTFALGDASILSAATQPGLKGFTATLPKPDQSWLRYEASVKYGSDTGVLVSKTLPSASELKSVDYGFLTGDKIKPESPKSLTALGKIEVTEAGKGEDILQQRTTPSSVVVLRWKALRAGYSVPTPALLTVGDVTPVLLRTERDEKKVADCGIPIVRCVGESVYYLPKLPTGELPFAFNPILDD